MSGKATKPAALPWYSLAEIRPRIVDSMPTTAVGIASHGCARAVALVYAGHGDGIETAEFIVRACNTHDELLAALVDLEQKFDYDPSSLTLAQSNALRNARVAIGKASKP